MPIHALLAKRARRTALVAALVMAATATSAVAANAAVVGPDVSSNNHSGGTIRWASVHSRGHASFAFVKATEGVRYRNPYFASDFASVRSHGMLRGAYDFARPRGTTHAAIVASARAEANHFVRTAGRLHSKGDLAPVLDIEVAGNLNPARLSLWTHTWLNRAQRLTGRTPIVYTYPSFWRSKMGNSRGFAKYPLWLASYRRTRPQMIGGWKRYTFWQYSASARLAGMSHGVDMSVFNGSYARLRGMAN